MDAVHDAIEIEMETDPSVFVAGIDVGRGGNVFGLTRGFHDRWPERVRDTPIAETSIVGMAVGAAMAGMRPIVEVMYLDFIGVCFDQLLNQAAKMRYMTGGRCTVPLVVRTQFGIGRSSGSQHSQSLEALLAHIPGLAVVMPSNPADAYGLLRAAIRDPNPVLFIENRLLYGRKGPQPARDHLVPIGTARIARAGRHLTVVAYSQAVLHALDAAARLAEDGIEAEVIDLRTVQPIDRATVLESLQRTGRLLVVQHSVVEFGVASEIARLASDDGFWNLDAPVSVVAPPFTPVPYAPVLEHAWLPDVDAIVRAAKRLVEQ
jgi:2-oxoisovalerate dehydrogenase E1 component